MKEETCIAEEGNTTVGSTSYSHKNVHHQFITASLNTSQVIELQGVEKIHSCYYHVYALVLTTLCYTYYHFDYVETQLQQKPILRAIIISIATIKEGTRHLRGMRGNLKPANIASDNDKALSITSSTPLINKRAVRQNILR